MRILLVEDEEYMAQAVAQVLEKNNYTVDLAHDGEYGLDCALSGIYDIIILDIAYQMQNQNRLKLENIHSTTLRYQEAYERNESFQMVGAVQEYADAFGVILDEENQSVFDSSFGVLPGEWVDRAIELTRGREEGQIVLDGKQYLFSKVPAYPKRLGMQKLG